MNSKFISYAAALFATAFLLQSCKKDDETNLKEYSNGVYIVNEGAFTNGTGTVSFWSRDNQVRDNDIYKNVNGVPVGNILQSMSIHNGLAYLVVNNANKVEIADPKTLENKSTITGLTLPRFFVGLNDTKGYVTEWVDVMGTMAGRVAVVNLATKQVTQTITVGIYPEKMELVGDKLYVVNSGDSTVTVINTATDAVENTITVGTAPNSIEADKNGHIWVLCGGNAWASTPIAPVLVKFNPASPNAQTTLNFSSATGASDLVINAANDKLYYIHNSAVYTVDITAVSLPSSPVVNRAFYSIGIDPQTGELYGGDALDYISAGRIIRYNTSFAPVDSFTTDVSPGDFYFVN